MATRRGVIKIRDKFIIAWDWSKPRICQSKWRCCGVLFYVADLRRVPTARGPTQVSICTLLCRGKRGTKLNIKLECLSITVYNVISFQTQKQYKSGSIVNEYLIES